MISYFNDSPLTATVVDVPETKVSYGKSCVDLSSWSPTINDIHNSKLGSALTGVYDFPDGKIDPSAPDLSVLRSASADVTEIDERYEQLKEHSKKISKEIMDKAKEDAQLAEEALLSKQSNSTDLASD